MTTISACAGTSIAPSSASRRRPPTRSTRDDIRTIPSLLRGELIKLTSVRSALTLVAITVLGGLLVSWAVAALVTDEVLYVAEVGFYWTVVTAVLASIGGVLLFTSEVQHGTLAGVVAAHPARWALVRVAAHDARYGAGLAQVGAEATTGGTLEKEATRGFGFGGRPPPRRAGDWWTGEVGEGGGWGSGAVHAHPRRFRAPTVTGVWGGYPRSGGRGGT